MILAEGLMQKVFLVYGAFWVIALIVLFIGIGALVKRNEQQRKHDSH